MSDIATALNGTTDPLIDADDLEAQISAVFAANGVTPEVAEQPAEPAADDPAVIDPAPTVDAPLPPVTPVDGIPVEGGIPDLTPEQIAAEALADPDAPTTADPTANLIDLGDGLVVDRAEAASVIQWMQSLDPVQVAAVERALANPTAASGSGTPGPVYTTPAPVLSPTYPPQPYPGYPPAAGQPGAPIYPTQPGAIPQPYPQPVAPYAPAPVAPQPGYPQTAQPYPQATPGQPGAPIPTPLAPPDLGALAELVPGLDTFLAAQHQQTLALQQQIAANNAFQQEQLVAQARDREAQQNAAIQAGRDQFAADHPDFTDVDLHYLATRAANMNSIVGLLREHNGDMRAAMNDALTTAIWSDPAYRDRVQQAAIQTHADTSADIAARREAAAALSGSRGAVGPTIQPSPTSLPPEQRRAALTSDIAAAIVTS